MPPPPRTGAETVAARADIQRDWADREFIQKVQFSYVKVATFLNKFGQLGADQINQPDLSTSASKNSSPHWTRALCQTRTIPF